MTKKQAKPKLETFGDKIIETVLDCIEGNNSAPFRGDCYDLRKGKLKKGPALLILVSPTKIGYYKLNIPKLSALFFKLESIDSLSRYRDKGSVQNTVIRFFGEWEKGFWLGVDVCLQPQPSN